MIQPAGPAHALVLAAIHATAFAPDEAWSAAMFAGHLGLPGVFGLVEEAGGLIIARVAADEAEILTLAVSPQARRTGVGAALVQAAVRQATGRGAARVYLEVSAENTAARRLYAKCGFLPVGKRRRYYLNGEDALILSSDGGSGGDGTSPPSFSTCAAAKGP